MFTLKFDGSCTLRNPCQTPWEGCAYPQMNEILKRPLTWTSHLSNRAQNECENVLGLYLQ
jgi:hypothetical protein